MHRRPQITKKAISSKQNKAGDISIPDFITHYRGIVSKQHSIGINRHTDQWHRERERDRERERERERERAQK
jgi:hypothetical protein